MDQQLSQLTTGKSVAFTPFIHTNFKHRPHYTERELQENLDIDNQILDNFHLIKYFGTCAQRRPRYNISMHQSAIDTKDTGAPH
jgi:uncharacterized lipoprotein YehR (DUF1307 family)